MSKIIDYYINNFKYLQIDIMFIKKKKKGKGKDRIVEYETYMFECSKESIKEAVKGTFERTRKILKKRKLDNYDLELSIDDTLQVIDEKKVVHSKEILSQMTIEYTDTNTLNDKIDFDKLDFLIMQVSSGKGNMPQIVFLKKHFRSSSKYKNSVRGTLNGKEYKPLSKKILTIGDNVDAFLINGKYYITNRNNFNSMLEFKDVYYKIIEQNTEDIIQSNLFDNGKQFIHDCQNDGRYIQRFTKAILADGFKNAKKYHHNLPDLIKKHKLKLTFNDEEEIVYSKAYVNEILNLLLQHYVTSDLTQKSMLAKAIEKYSE